MDQNLVFMFNELNTQQNNITILIVFVACCLVILLLRAMLCIGYQAQLAIFNLNAKEIKARTEIKKIKSGILSKVISDYVKIGEKGVASIDTKSIVGKYILRIHFLGWSFDSIEYFITRFEKTFVFIGILLVFVFEEYRYVYAVATIGMFLLLLIFGSIFDFRLLKFKLLEEITEYVDREVGQFYAGDVGSIVIRLKNELSEAVLRQSENMGESIVKMGNDLSGVLRLSLNEMSKSVENTMMKVSDYSAMLKEPLEQWRGVISEAASAQEQINSACYNLETAIKGFDSVSNRFETGMASYSQNVSEQTDVIQRKIADLSEIAVELKTGNASVAVGNAALQKQLKYIEKNQDVLEQSLQHYETSLENFAGKIGDGLGSILEFHMQSAYGTLNENLEGNIKQIINNNNELVLRLQQLFEQMSEQSRSETQTIIKIKEQMDMHFEALSDKLV